MGTVKEVAAKKKKKSITAVMKGNHINSEIFTSGLENVMLQLWQENRQTPHHSNPQPLPPPRLSLSLHQGGSVVDILNMYNPENVLIFYLVKKGHKNPITWNCHSSFVHSSSLLMFGFCHKLSLITRYSELQSRSPQRHSHIQPAGLNKTAHIYYIWHTPSSFCFISN